MASAPIMRFTCLCLLLLLLLFNAWLTIIALPHEEPFAAENAGDEDGADSTQKGIVGTGYVGAGTRSLGAHKNVKNMREETKIEHRGKASEVVRSGANDEEEGGKKWQGNNVKGKNYKDEFVAFTADYHSPRHHPPKNN